MASGSGQYYPVECALAAAGAVFAGGTFFFESPATARAQPVVPAHLFMPQGPPPAFGALIAPQAQMPMASTRGFVGHPVLPPWPPQTPSSPRPVADMIKMVPLQPNHAFWAPYRSGSGRPVELDLLGLFGGGPAEQPSESDDNTSVASSSPTFMDWIQEDDGSSVNMQVESYMDY